MFKIVTKKIDIRYSYAKANEMKAKQQLKMYSTLLPFLVCCYLGHFLKNLIKKAPLWIIRGPFALVIFYQKGIRMCTGSYTNENEHSKNC